MCAYRINRVYCDLSCCWVHLPLWVLLLSAFLLRESEYTCFNGVLMSTMENTDLSSACGGSAVYFQVNLLIAYSGQAFSTLDSWFHLHESDITSCLPLTERDTSQAYVSLGKHTPCFCRTSASLTSLSIWVDIFLWRKSRRIDKKALRTNEKL